MAEDDSSEDPPGLIKPFSQLIRGKLKSPVIQIVKLSSSRADPEQCCWGGARTVGGCELDGAKRRRASARELRQGSGGAKIGLLES